LTVVSKWYHLRTVYCAATLLPEAAPFYAISWEPVYAGTLVTRASWPKTPDGRRRVLRRKESDLEAHAGHRCVKTVLLDVDDEAAAVPFAQAALEQFGGVDALVNNAGYYQMGPLEGTSMEQVHRQYQTNVFSIAALIKAFLPAFRAQRSGMIINIASLTAEQGYPYNSVYASSKAAVALLSESLNIELAEFGVIVRAILPGMSATRIFTKIDRGDSIPDAYQAGIARFFASNPSTGSDPAVTADVIYRAVTDPDPTAVRYYSAPDSASTRQ
jgi:NAD(P)-dependent dehydrogenase (short-subunit alcohol dehydrogenase family)